MSTIKGTKENKVFDAKHQKAFCVLLILVSWIKIVINEKIVTY